MTKKKLGIGLIGAGFIGRAHAFGYHTMPAVFANAGALPVRFGKEVQALPRHFDVTVEPLTLSLSHKGRGDLLIGSVARLLSQHPGTL